MQHDEVRYAVVGLGHIAQVAVLPGFRNAARSRPVAVFSGDPAKREHARRYHGIEYALDYDAYDTFLERGLVDAVYITLPNHLHCDFTVRAAERGIHVLCEKPLAVDEREAERMITATDRARVELMTAYRLHFDRANLEAIEAIRRGRIGEPRVFSSTFTQSVAPGNVRLLAVERGGGPVYDLGVYCINAARYVFRDEPIEVIASAIAGNDPRFRACPEAVSATLRFPGARLASFTCSFGAHSTSRYEVIGDSGRLVMEPAYDYATELAYGIDTDDGRQERERRFRKHDQFGAEIEYFSRCIVERRRVEPDGLEGLADVRIIRAIHRSAREGRAIALTTTPQQRRPTLGQAIEHPGIEKPPVVHAHGARGD